MGRPSPGNNGGTAALMKWEANVTSDQQQRTVRRSQSAGKVDFVRMNKTAVKQGLVTAKDQWRGRDTIQQQLSAPATLRRSSGRRRFQDTVRGQVHGSPSGEKLPLGPLFRHDYAEDWKEEAHAKSSALSQSQSRSRGRSRSVPTTRTAVLRQHVPAPPPKPLWKMSKFAGKGPVVGSFR